MEDGRYGEGREGKKGQSLGCYFCCSNQPHHLKRGAKALCYRTASASKPQVLQSTSSLTNYSSHWINSIARKNTPGKTHFSSPSLSKQTPHQRTHLWDALKFSPHFLILAKP